MAVYFYYAERDEKTLQANRMHLNQTSGLISGYSLAEDAFERAMIEVREDLGNTKQFTIKKFEKVED